MNLLQQTTTVNIPKMYSSLEKASEFVRKRWQSTRRTIKSNEFAFATPWLPDLLCKQWFTSSLFFFPNKFAFGTHDYRVCYVNNDLRHQYGISVAESQTLAKRPWRRGATRNGSIRRLHPLTLNFRLLDTRLYPIGLCLACFENDVLKLSLTEVRELGK